MLDPGDGHLVREMSLGDDSENACGLHVEGERYWIGWKSEATIEERDRASHRTVATYPGMPRIAGLTMRREALKSRDRPIPARGKPDRPVLGWSAVLVQRLQRPPHMRRQTR